MEGAAKEFRSEKAIEGNVARDVYQRFKLALEDSDHSRFVDEALINENYYCGDQWKESDRKKLESVGRPALTINKVLPTLNTIFGEQITKRAVISYKATRDASAESAHAKSKLAMAVLKANQYQWKETEVFQDGHITGRGWFDIRMDFEKNFLGEIQISTEHFSEVIPDPAARDYDPETWNEGYVMRWRTLDQIEAEYGKEKRREIEMAGYQRHLPTGAVRWGKPGTFGYATDNMMQSELAQLEDTEISKAISEVLIVERQSVRMEKRHYLIQPETLKERPLPFGTEKKEAEALALQYGAYLHSRFVKRIWWEVVCGDRILLHNDWSIYRSFTFVPYFPYFRRGKSFGSVKNLRSPQDQLNKLASQELHIVNTTANSGWVIEQGSVVNMTPDQLQAKGAQSGLVIVTAPGRRAPEKIKPNTVPTGIDRISMKSDNYIKEISNVSDAMLGTESAEVSGVALEKKQNRGQVSLIPAVDNLERTRFLVARKILELMQDFITEPRIYQITSDLDPEEYESLEVNNPERPETMMAMGTYDIVIGSMPANDTYQEQQLAQTLNMRNLGAPIPWYRIMQLTNIQDKKALAAELQSIEGLTPPTEEEAQMAAMVQQMQLQLQQLQLSELAGKIAKLESEVLLNQAKAQEAGVAPTIEMQRMESELAQKREEFDLRRQLAALSSVSKLDAIRAQGSETMKQTLLANLTQKQGATNNATTK